MTVKVYDSPANAFAIDDGCVKVEPGATLHKVSGTSLGGILGCSPWSSPFQVACNLLGVCRENLDGKPAVEVGKNLEGPIIDYADRTYYNIGGFYPAEEIYEKRVGDHDSWVSDFQDDTFAGHVDGIVLRDDGDYILEVKTSSNMESWVDGVPEYYKLQVELYNHFITKQDKAYVVLGKVNENTYKDWHTWIPNENTVALFELEIDQDAFAGTLDEVREWYGEYILNGITPPYDPTNPGDVEMYNHLIGISQDIDVMSEKVSQYRDLRYEIDAIEAENKDRYDALEALKAELKDYMEANNLVTIPSKEGDSKVSLSTTNRKSLDEGAMIKDGIDVDKYRITKKVNTLRFKE